MKAILYSGMILALSACNGGSSGSAGSLNPFNWFQGGSQSQPQKLSLAPHRGYPRNVEARPLVAQITGLAIERTATGAIVRATGQTPNEGFYDAALVLVPGSARNELVLHFRARPPGQITPVRNAFLRELVAGFRISREQLRGIRRVTVVGQNNSLSKRP